MSKMKWFVVIAILVMMAGASVWFFKKRNTNAVSYREVVTLRTDLEITTQSTGTVAPENRLEIKPPIAGRVEQILVNEGDRVRKGQLMAWMSSTERAALLDAASSKGPDELKRWQSLYRATPIMAPINGTIIKRNVEAGQTFSSADSIFVLSDRLTVKAQVDETDISQIKVGQVADIILDAYASKAVAARVDQIAHDATTVNNVTTYVVDVLPQKTPEFMRSGMTANVTFHVETRPQVLTLPSETLRFKGGKTTVLLKSAQRKLPPIEKEVSIGLTDGKQTEILSGLSENDVVLVAETKATSDSGTTGTKNPFTPARPQRRSSSH